MRRTIRCDGYKTHANCNLNTAACILQRAARGSLWEYKREDRSPGSGAFWSDICSLPHVPAVRAGNVAQLRVDIMMGDYA